MASDLLDQLLLPGQNIHHPPPSLTLIAGGQCTIFTTLLSRNKLVWIRSHNIPCLPPCPKIMLLFLGLDKMQGSPAKEWRDLQGLRQNPVGKGESLAECPLFQDCSDRGKLCKFFIFRPGITTPVHNDTPFSTFVSSFDCSLERH